MTTTITCELCGRRTDAARGGGSPCAVCQSAKLPPEPLALHGKWSPLAVGALSLVCDPVLITTVIAVTRGAGRLRAAAKYEREVGYHPSLPGIRTDAIWGIVLGSLRVWVVLGIIAAVFLAALLLRPTTPGPLVTYPDERTEILNGLASDDRDERALAAEHAAEAVRSGAPSAARLAEERQRMIAALARALDQGDDSVAWHLACVLVGIGGSVDDISAFYRASTPSLRGAFVSTASYAPSASDDVLSELLRVEAELLRAGAQGVSPGWLREIAFMSSARRIDLDLVRENADLPPFAELLELVCTREDIDCGAIR